MRHRLAMTCLLLIAFAVPATAGLNVTIDRESLDLILGEITTQRSQVPLPNGTSVDVVLQDLRIERFIPGNSSSEQPGGLEVTVTVQAPDLGVTLPLRPRLAFDVVEVDGRRQFRLSFENVELNLGITRVDLSRAMRPMLYSADQLVQLDGAGGAVPLRYRLREVEVAADALHFEIDLLVGAEAEAP